MKLVAFSVRNYRSIVEAYKLSLGNYTVLVGPNNEGKSNILKAIALSLAVLTRARVRRRLDLDPFATTARSLDLITNGLETTLYLCSRAIPLDALSLLLSLI